MELRKRRYDKRTRRVLRESRNVERLQHSLFPEEGTERMRGEETISHLEENGVERKSLE